MQAKKTQGYLLLLAAFLVVIGAFLVTTVGHLITNRSSTANSNLDTVDAFYIANAGIQRALYHLNTNTLADKITCDDIAASNDFDTVSFGNGQFDVTANLQSATSAALTAAINLSTTTIPVSALATYTTSGQVMIDSEVINYTFTTSLSAECGGNAPCLLGATRGVGTTDAAVHSSGATIVQYRCHITSTGAIPNLSSPTGKRIISIDSYGTIEQGWIVGNKDGANENIIQWNGNSWSPFGPLSAIPNKHLNGIFMLNYIDGWAVGQKNGNQSLLIHWNGSSWTNSSTSVVKQDLKGVACVNSNDCWAVGNKKTFLHWDGNTWNTGNLNASIPDKTVNAVTCITTDDCWAVGEKKGQDTFIAHWDGTEWDLSSSTAKQTFKDVDCTSTDDCWAVGKKENFSHWNGSNWSKVSAAASVPNKDMNSISCSSSSNCWAVGTNEGGDALFVHWDGTTWSRVIPDSTVANKKLLSVECLTNNSCWAVGNNGTVAYWDGSSWTDGSTGSVPNKTLNAIAMLGQVDNNNPFTANWLEE